METPPLENNNKNTIVNECINVQNNNNLTEYQEALRNNMIRNINNRIFTVRPTDFGRIEAIGFDLDYTLVEYNREYEHLIYDLTVDTLIERYGYPVEIRKLQYDSSLGRKGLFIDKESGHVLSINEFGFIEVAMHGLILISRKEDLEQIYPDRCIKVDDLLNTGQGDTENSELRFYLISTSFAAPLVCLYLQLVDYFERRQAISDPLLSNNSSLISGDNDVEYMTRLIYSPNQTSTLHVGQLSYANLYQDVSRAMSSIHYPSGLLKTRTKQCPGKYCKKNPLLGPMLSGLRKAGKTVFLITNSDYTYTDNMLTYLLGKSWQSDFFDYVIVEANKPAFFSCKTSDFRMVEKKTGNKLLGSCGSKFIPGMVYAGGNIDLFHKYIDTKKGRPIKQKATAYVGDHIMGDITIVRTDNFWRTCLIIPEAAQEAVIMQKLEAEYKKIESLEYERICLTAKLTLNDIVKPPRLEQIQNEISEISVKLNFNYNKNFGSMFSTWSHSWLGAQIQSSCDLYTSSACNFYYYPPYYIFSINNSNRFLPHQKNPRMILPRNKVTKASPDLTVFNSGGLIDELNHQDGSILIGDSLGSKQMADVKENEIVTSCDLNVTSPSM